MKILCHKLKILRIYILSSFIFLFQIKLGVPPPFSKSRMFLYFPHPRVKENKFYCQGRLMGQEAPKGDGTYVKGVDIVFVMYN